MAIEDLKQHVAAGATLEETASFLCRTGDPLAVAKKAKELGLRWQQGRRASKAEVISGMKRVTSKPPAAKVRDWRVSIIRKKLERLGRVAAADRDAAEAAAWPSSG